VSRHVRQSFMHGGRTPGVRLGTLRRLAGHARQFFLPYDRRPRAGALDFSARCSKAAMASPSRGHHPYVARCADAPAPEPVAQANERPECRPAAKSAIPGPWLPTATKAKTTKDGQGRGRAEPLLV
jgi:hypothetical protein